MDLKVDWCFWSQDQRNHDLISRGKNDLWKKEVLDINLSTLEEFIEEIIQIFQSNQKIWLNPNLTIGEEISDDSSNWSKRKGALLKVNTRSTPVGSRGFDGISLSFSASRRVQTKLGGNFFFDWKVKLQTVPFYRELQRVQK